jgi:integrase
LDEVWKRWVEGVEKKDLSTSVMRNHNATYGKLGSLLDKRMRDIKTAHLQKWMNDIDLKPSTKGKMKNSMQQVFDYAIKNDIVVKNYADFIEINEKIEHTGSIFTDYEIQVLWENIDMIGVRELLILIYTGMRIGEMLAISRDNINFDEGYIIGGIKTEAGKNRVIPLHNRILPLVKEQLGDNKWLMQSNRGVAMSYKNASLRLNKVFDKFGFNHKIHDTRRTAVSLMHTSGIPMETIRVIVGHSGKGVTEKIYLYKEPKELVDIINTLKIPY